MAMTAIAMLGAIVASSASATNVTLPSRWTVNGAKLNAGQSAKVKCSVHEEEGVGKKLILDGEVGEGSEKIKVKLTATAIECINHEGTSEGNGSARIEQTGTGTEASPYQAEDFGRFVFTGVTVSEPANCTVAGGTVTTNPLQSKLIHDAAETKHEIVYDRFTPTGTNFASVKIEGASCSVAGTRIAKGAFCGKAENKTGVDAVNQPITSSLQTEETIESAGKTGEESCKLEFAGNIAHLTGTINNELAGANAGFTFGAAEK
jgi:hypothetical protein